MTINCENNDQVKQCKRAPLTLDCCAASTAAAASVSAYSLLSLEASSSSATSNTCAAAASSAAIWIQKCTKKKNIIIFCFGFFTHLPGGLRSPQGMETSFFSMLHSSAILFFKSSSRGVGHPYGRLHPCLPRERTTWLEKQ